MIGLEPGHTANMMGKFRHNSSYPCGDNNFRESLKGGGFQHGASTKKGNHAKGCFGDDISELGSGCSNSGISVADLKYVGFGSPSKSAGLKLI